MNRLGFGERLSGITDVGELKEEIADVLAENGRAYGIYEEKELVGVYLFEKRENYFVKTKTEIKLGDREFNLDEFEEFWYGSSTAALVLKKCICLKEAEDGKEELEKDIKADLTDYIQIFGQVAGVEWNDKLLYQKRIKKESNRLLKMLGWFVVGAIMGWIIFEEAVMVVCMGFLWGSLGLAGIEEGTQIDTLDFVRKGEVEADAVK
ncbi:MAG: hypothetical protein NC300_10730 [Bacteroidales bacterium]|nr:hypothetical protein [Clostridium sp.]MCM1204606.1 hypothetical protein [Bacteroidales bacterium]